jgi:two-component system, LytTR family, response regulator
MKSTPEIILIDDSEDNLQLLSRKIGLCQINLKIAGAYTEPEMALKAILKQPPSLILTDIEMPGLTGFELVGQIRHLKIPVIFVTAFESYALKAIKFSAIDYLMKPVDLQELKDALKKVLDHNNNFHQQEIAQEYISANHHRSEQFSSIVINTQERAYIMNIEDIMQIEARQSYSQISDLNGSTVLSSKPIQHYEELLKDWGFFRSHRSYLVNTRHVAQVDKEGVITMRNGFRASINKELITILIGRLGRK